MGMPLYIMCGIELRIPTAGSGKGYSAADRVGIFCAGRLAAVSRSQAGEQEAPASAANCEHLLPGTDVGFFGCGIFVCKY